MKTVVVLFNTYNPRILVNPKNLEELQKLPYAVVNPNLKKVKGIAPHCWKAIGNDIIPLTEEEAREKRIEHGIADVYIAPKAIRRKVDSVLTGAAICLFFLGVLVGVILCG